MKFGFLRGNLLALQIAADAVIAAAAVFTIIFTGIPAAAVCIAAISAAAVCAAVCEGIRRRQLRDLINYLRKINSGEYGLDIRDNAEGELSLLKNEIYKTTLTLRSQNEQLKKEKSFLASLMSDISHQLKTPLTSMCVITDIVSDPNTSEEDRQKFISRLSGQTDRLQWLVESMLKLSRLDAEAVKFTPREISAEELAGRAAQPVMIPADVKNITLSCRAEGTVYCDAEWTAEALGNILKNCAEHAPCGGHIEIVCENNPLFTEIRISDDGCGISEEDRPHIFERFYTGGGRQGGAGIGLSLAKSIIESQSGSIAAPRTDGGATFVVRLPRGQSVGE